MYDYNRTAALTDSLFERMVALFEKNAKDMRAQVQRLGGIEKALERGHAQTLKEQLNEIANGVRALQRHLG